MDKLSFQRTRPSEQDAEQCGDMYREEQLRTTLHCDDKEKLRRKLVLLQREYLKTAERLQRAERFDAVRRHVRSRISQQDQRDPEVTSNPRLSPSSLILNATNVSATSVAQRQGHTEGPVDSDNSRRSQVIRFLLPSDAACPESQDPSHDAARGHRSSPALRLRSRRSRLRWERRSAEAGRSTDENSEEGREQSEQMETGSEERVKTEGTEVVNGSDELFSGTDSESPSLLLTHWNTCGQTETGDVEGEEIRGGQEQRETETELRTEGKNEPESTALVLTCRDPVIHDEEREQNSREQRDGRLCEDGSNTNTEQNAAEKIESEKSPDDTSEIKEETSAMVGGDDVKGVSLLDSCTLVEGLLFPAEYYVRTTRRMTFSQSQPDMQAVILSQLSVGRQCRGRGRGRGLNRQTHNNVRSDQHTPAGLSSPTSASAGPRLESQSADTSTELNSQRSCEISEQVSACQINTDACSSPIVPAARPARGRRKRRGRGRGRPQTPRCSLSLDTSHPGLGPTSDNLRPTSSPVCVPSASVHSPDTQPSSGVVGTQSSSASGHLEKVFPIFLKNSDGTNRSTQMSRSAASWRSLLLPSSPLAHTSLLPLPSLFPLFNNLMNFDITQDFHLPDDQFASLKLHKLRQVAVDSGVEHFTSPSYNTRRSTRRFDTRYGSSDAVAPLPLPLSLTPTIINSPHLTEAKRAATQSFTEETSEGVIMETPAEQQTASLHPDCQTQTAVTESASLVPDCAAECVDQYKERETMILNIDHPVKPQPHINFADRPAGKVDDHAIGRSGELQIKESSVVSSEDQSVCPGVVRPLEEHGSIIHQTEDKDIIETLSFDCPLQKTPEEPSNSCAAVQLCNDSEAPEESAPASSSPRTERFVENKCFPHRSSQLLLSPPLASASGPFITPHLPSSALLSSPTLPSLGLTPHPVPAALPLPSSPSAPPLTLPSAHSQSIQALSPPALSPSPSLPPRQPPTSPAGEIQASSEPLCTDGQSVRVEPHTCPTVSTIHPQGSGGQVETAEEHMMRCTHTLKAPAGGCLVDACCLAGSSGGLCVAAAGKWAVCLWSQTSASDWSLTHTWAFNEPVINVFPVPDAAGLMCVTLGQLEISEVRMLSCSSLSQVLLCEGVVQAVVGVSRSRVVTSSHSASGSTLQVFTLSDSGSTPSSQPLVSPGVCVGALAAVGGLTDALIGSDESGRLFVWNLKTGQLLQRIILGDGLSHMACLRGYSYCGVLFVLLQHQLLSSLEEEAKEKEEERKTIALFSLVAINPLSGKSVPATLLYPPKGWCGRLCEADVNSSSVVGLSQSGCVCVWELGHRGTSRMVWAPESEGWQLARWGGEGTLVTGHHNGDVTLHRYSTSQTSLGH
ncbi:partner and localizer of BRCA2 isoform X2 [Cottoperca gobio]|uniref:Partner and localizer of BRCA2 isoform X2 n=1 Tax=Cottoperca gobio TaxID=56716 RepID=A0A6J2PYW5_COTGO|nr:partner and localizer of BRCA2 isoform X2 [Cottoperca gobio]